VKVAVLALCVYVIGVAAQDETPVPTPAVMPPPMMDPSAMVAYQSFVGQKILSLHLKIQTAQHMTMAGTTYFSLMMQSMQSGPRDEMTGSVIDDLDDDSSSEDEGIMVAPVGVPVIHPIMPVPVVVGVDDDDLDVGSSDSIDDEMSEDLGDSDSEELAMLEYSSSQDLEEGGSVYLDPDHQTIKAKQSLLAAYHLFFAVKHWMHKTIFQAGEMQQEYWADRSMQTQAQAFGSALPPQMVQMLYLRSFRTHMETLKLSQQLQTISHFVMWLEDEIDVGKALSMDDPTFHDVVLDDQSDDIVQDKMFAFNSFNTYAMLDMQIFYIDMYLQYMLAATTQAAAGAAGPAGSSFLEVEEKPFLPFMMGMGMGGGNPQAMQQFVFIMSLYRVMYQMYAAHAGMTSAMAESVANHHDDEDPKKAYTFRTFARQSFGSFGMFLMNMSHIDMYIGMIELSSFSGQGGMGGGMGGMGMGMAQ